MSTNRVTRKLNLSSNLGHSDTPVVPNSQRLINTLLQHFGASNQIAIYTSNANFQDPTTRIPIQYDLLVGIDAITQLQPHSENPFEELKSYHNQVNDWIFGHLSYDLKNSLEKLSSNNPDGIGFPILSFFQPKLLIFLKGQELTISWFTAYTTQAEIDQLCRLLLENQASNPNDSSFNHASELQPQISKSEYINKVAAIQQHIQAGNCYELNFCIEFAAHLQQLDPVASFQALDAISRAPFAAYYKLNEHYLLCASPERFLKKTGKRLISQPIKGTIRRGKSSDEDQQLKIQLQNDPKEQSENIMVVDLVRNDLSRTAARGTVKVDELMGIYSFFQVHQMISTISSELDPAYHPIDAIKSAFPMGSMTGVPKIRVMQLIEEIETTRRGLYSGALGYIDPQGDFDFNVVIRSIQYNERTAYTSVMVGSAITAKSIPEQEYNECLLKANAMLKSICVKSPAIDAQ